MERRLEINEKQYKQPRKNKLSKQFPKGLLEVEKKETKKYSNF